MTLYRSLALLNWRRLNLLVLNRLVAAPIAAPIPTPTFAPTAVPAPGAIAVPIAAPRPPPTQPPKAAPTVVPATSRVKFLAALLTVVLLFDRRSSSRLMEISTVINGTCAVIPSATASCSRPPRTGGGVNRYVGELRRAHGLIRNLR